MQNVHALVALASSRLRTTRLLTALSGVGLLVGLLLLGLAVADRIGPAPIVPWIIVLPLLASGLIISVVIIVRLRARSVDELAAMIDERLELRDRLTTALALHHRDDAFAQAAVADAVSVAARPQTRELLKRRFPVQFPADGWQAPVLLLIALGILLFPQWSIIVPEREDPEAIRLAALEVEEEVDAVVRRIEEMSALREALGDLIDRLDDADDHAAGGLRKAEDIRREGVRRMTDLTQRLEELLRGEQGQTLSLLEQMTGRLDLSGDEHSRALAEAIRAGDFTAAKEALERMLEQLADGMEPEAAAAMAEAMADLARQLEELAAGQEAMEAALQQAGLDPALAGAGMQELEQALQEAAHLNEQQKQQLRDLMQAQQQAAGMCQGLGQALAELAQQLGQGGGAEGGGDAMEQLGRMEALQELIRQAQQAQGMCQNPGGLGRGLGLAQAIEQWGEGGGMGGWGIGAGGRAELEKTDTQRTEVRERVEVGEGEMIARMLVEGVPIRGESRAQLVDVVARAAQGLEEAIQEEVLPRRYHEALKHYFGELEARARAIQSADSETEND